MGYLESNPSPLQLVEEKKGFPVTSIGQASPKGAWEEPGGSKKIIKSL